MPKYGWIGYHPSLLPRHRGRSAIEWALKMNDAVTGGTIFWLNAGLDRGDIICQDWFFIPPELTVSNCKSAALSLWRDELMPIGIKLMGKALAEVSCGVITRKPQDARFSTFEPCIDVDDVFKPDLLMIG